MPANALHIPERLLRQAALPHIVDPIHDGAADPAPFWNERTGEWWCLFVQRRANTKTVRPTWNGRCHGTDVAVASAGDGGRRWLYRGTLPLSTGWRQDTFWGPDVVRDDDGTTHLFVTHIDGVPNDEAWDTFGRPSPWHRRIRHYRSTDTDAWELVGALDLGTDWAVDATVSRLPDGRWGIWFKAEAAGGAVWFCESSDLMTWSRPVEAIGGWHEGPDVFELAGRLWLIAETRDPGFAVYRSDDGRTWTPSTPLSVTLGDDLRPARSPNVTVTAPAEATLAFYAQYSTDAFGADVPTSGRSSTNHLVRLTTDGEELRVAMFDDLDPLPSPRLHP